MRSIILFLFLVSSGMVLADSNVNPRLAQLEATMNRLQQEQQSLYQQFQMTLELRKIEMPEISSLATQIPPTVTSVDSRALNYDENVRLQRDRQERIRQYTSDLSRLNSRYSELAEQKQVLLDQMVQLAQHAVR